MTYDVTRQASLLNIRNWLSDLDEMTQVVVVGNKCDLVKGKSRLATGSWNTRLMDQKDVLPRSMGRKWRGS